MKHAFLHAPTNNLMKSTAKFWLATSIINVIVCLICCLVTIANGCRMFRSAKIGWKEATAAANVQVFLAFLLTGVMQIFTGIESQDPSLTTKPPTPTGQKTATTQVGRNVIFVFGICAVITAAMTIALVWLEVAERARKMAHRGGETMIPRTRMFATVFEIILTVAMIALCAAYATSIAVIVGIIAIIVVASVYLAGYVQVYRELKSVSSIAAESSKVLYRAVIKEVQRTTILIILCAGVLLALCVILLILSLSDWKQTAPTGTIPGIVIAWQVLPMAIILFAIVLLDALRRATARKIATVQTESASSAKDENTAPPFTTAGSYGSAKVEKEATAYSSVVVGYQIDEKM